MIPAALGRVRDVRISSRGHAPIDPHVPALWVDGAPIKAVDVSTDELERADCVLVLTDHPEFDYAAVAQHGRLIVDTRHSVPALSHGRGRLVRL